MITYVLILVLSTSSSSQAGAAAVTQEFNSESACRTAGSLLVKAVAERRSYVLTWGCFNKGAK